MDDERQEEWDQLSSSVGAGYLTRWNLHDPESLERALAAATAAPGIPAGEGEHQSPA